MQSIKFKYVHKYTYFICNEKEDVTTRLSVLLEKRDLN